jgi:hypothetical protein
METLRLAGISGRLQALLFVKSALKNALTLYSLHWETAQAGSGSV